MNHSNEIYRLNLQDSISDVHNKINILLDNLNRCGIDENDISGVKDEINVLFIDLIEKV